MIRAADLSIASDPIMFPTSDNFLISSFELTLLQGDFAITAAWMVDPGMELVNSNWMALPSTVVAALLNPKSLTKLEYLDKMLSDNFGT